MTILVQLQLHVCLFNSSVSKVTENMEFHQSPWSSFCSSTLHPGIVSHFAAERDSMLGTLWLKKKNAPLTIGPWLTKMDNHGNSWGFLMEFCWSISVPVPHERIDFSRGVWLMRWSEHATYWIVKLCINHRNHHHFHHPLDLIHHSFAGYCKRRASP